MLARVVITVALVGAFTLALAHSMATGYQQTLTHRYGP